MTFVNPLYLIFIIIVAFLYYLVKSVNLRQLLLLFSNSLIYLSFGLYNFYVLWIIIIVSYLSAFFIRKKLFLIFVILSIFPLFYTKYLNYFLGVFHRIFNVDLGSFEIFLPIGISFYTFQAVGYLMDVKSGKEKIEKNFLKYALFISFFPQVIAGPIEKLSKLMPQLNRRIRFNICNIEKGLLLIFVGLFQKLVIADRLGMFVSFQNNQEENSLLVFLISNLFFRYI